MKYHPGELAMKSIQRIIPFCLAIFCLIQISHAQSTSNTCTTVAGQMYDAYKNKTDFDSQPWGNLSWLQTNLGAPQTVTTVDKIYNWGNYSIKIEGDMPQMLIEMGSRPTAIQNMQAITVDKAISILGQPDKIDENNVVTYSWNCKESQSKITMRIVSSPTLTATSYNGTYCAGTSCNKFASAMRIELK